jgi:hypothetical protein
MIELVVPGHDRARQADLEHEKEDEKARPAVEQDEPGAQAVERAPGRGGVGHG